ncbi:MAG: ABC transporter permease [Patescibacteria group bacterium]|jgi:NitT/TauT family transport system permease protein
MTNSLKTWFKLLIIKLIFTALLIGLWQIIVWLEIWPIWLIPGPAQVANVLYRYSANHKLWLAIIISFRRLLIGFGISLVIGSVLGVLLAKVALARQTIGFLVMGLQTLPSVCWLPLALLWFGLNDKAIIFVVIMGALLSITIAVQGAIRTMPPLWLRVGNMLGANGWKKYYHIILPAILPNLVTGLKQSWSFAWRSLMGGEMLFISVGLGQLLMIGRELNDMALVIAIMITIITIGLVVDYFIFGSLERSLYRKWGLK